LNALANKAKGGGYEDCGAGQNYTNCRLVFCDIENIHAVRNAFDKMMAIQYGAYMFNDWKTLYWQKQVTDTDYL
jgi:hypothetical protein